MYQIHLFQNSLSLPSRGQKYKLWIFGREGHKILLLKLKHFKAQSFLPLLRSILCFKTFFDRTDEIVNALVSFSSSAIKNKLITSNSPLNCTKTPDPLFPIPLWDVIQFFTPDLPVFSDFRNSLPFGRYLNIKFGSFLIS